MASVLPGGTRGTKRFDGPSPGKRPLPRKPHTALLSAPHLLQLLEGLRPVRAQEPGEGPVRQQLPARLTGRAVVRLVLRVDDALYRRSAHGAGLLVLSVDGH